jgi:hypothetical protein
MANTFISDAAEFDSTAVVIDKQPAVAGIAGIINSIAERFASMRQRRVDAEIGEFIEQHGGQLTDDLERQISRRFGTPSGQW